MDINRNGILNVNARELYAFLEAGRDFSNWIKDQIERARLVKDRDYVTLTVKEERQMLIEYHLGLDTADHICMLSQTEKGHRCRQNITIAVPPGA